MSFEPTRSDEPFRLPNPLQVRNRLANALREVEVLRRLLRLTEFAERRRQFEGQQSKGSEASR